MIPISTFQIVDPTVVGEIQIYGNDKNMFLFEPRTNSRPALIKVLVTKVLRRATKDICVTSLVKLLTSFDLNDQ